jgi:malate dehydrogenase
MKKITIIGAGRVGESTALSLAKEDLVNEITLIDVREGTAVGAALDIQETAPLVGFDTHLSGSTDPAAMAGSDIVIITAGIPRKPGMSRIDVLDTNVKIIDNIVDEVVKHAPGAMMLMVSNPVDILTYRAWKRSGWPRTHVFGQAGVLDSSRMASFVAMETGFSTRDISAMMLGSHGDAMVPLMRYTTISGIPVDHFIDQATRERIIERSRHAGAEILSLKQNSSAYEAPAAAISTMVCAVARNRKRILPTVAILEGEYGHEELAMGVPCMLGEDGMERIIELQLNAEEQAMFDRSIATIQEGIKLLDKM